MRKVEISMVKEHRSMKDECRWRSFVGLGVPYFCRGFHSALLLLAAALLLCGCGKQKVAAKAEVPNVVKPTLLTEAAKLGLAARIPSDVEFCVCSVGLKKHWEALRASRYGKELLALLDDKLPVWSGMSKSSVDEVCVAFGHGSTKSLAILRQLNDLYNETAYRGMMSGGVLASLSTTFDAKKMLDVALRDPQMLDALILQLERLEMPSILIGAVSPEPEVLLQQLRADLHLAEWLKGMPEAKITTTQGEAMSVFQITMDQVLTQERRREWTEVFVQASPDATAEMKDRVARGLEVLAGKKWVLALGSGAGRVFFAIAKSMEDIRLASSVEDSMLARPELRFADAHVGKKLGLVACWDGKFWDVLESEEPFQPLVRGLLAGLKAEKLFAGAAQALEPKVALLAAAEREFYHREHANGAAVAWWEDGLHADFAGGVAQPELGGTSQFGGLLEDPEVVLGISGLGTSTGSGRAYFEAWAGMAYATAQELVKAGVGGEKAAQMIKLADQTALPGVIGVYEGSKTIYQKALGTDGAVILDIGGKMPLLPGLPAGGESLPLPRLVSLHEIKNRRLIGVSWENMETSLQQVVSAVPAGAEIKLPPVLTRRSGGLTSHGYELTFGSDDLMPCVSLTEKVFMLGTSMAQQKELAQHFKLPGAVEVTAGTRMKLNFTKLRVFLKAFAAVRAQNGGTEGLKTTLKWMEPFDTLDLRVWSEGEQARGALSWKIHDVLSYD